MMVSFQSKEIPLIKIKSRDSRLTGKGKKNE